MIEDSPIRLLGDDHVVHFYEADQDLIGAAGAYLTSAVVDGDTVIVIASGEHLRAFASVMESAGVNVATQQDAGALVLLDAGEVLSRFMADGMPDPDAFDRVLGSMVRDAAARGRPIRAFGEMVAVLWARGQVVGAVELERLWNDLRSEVPFGLFCAYPRSMVAGDDSLEAFHEVCDAHSHVLAGAPLPVGAHRSRRFLAHPEAARRARRFVAATIDDWGVDQVRDDTLLAAAELAANAVMHAGGDFTIGLAQLPDGLRLMVGDTNPGPVAPHIPGHLSVGGRGLLIVDAIADDWGYELLDGGKVVWADFLAARTEAYAGR